MPKDTYGRERRKGKKKRKKKEEFRGKVRGALVIL